MSWYAQWRNRMNRNPTTVAADTAPVAVEREPEPEPRVEHDPMLDIEGIAKAAKAIKPLTGHVLVYWFSGWDISYGSGYRTGVAIGIGPDVEFVGVGDVIVAAHYVVLPDELAGSRNARFMPCQGNSGPYSRLLLADAGQFVAKISGQVPESFTKTVRRVVGGDMGRLD